ncbi:APC family permease [Serinibacter arcticus]|nr:amino acid permease [Serinibacter arcticus]
MHGGPGGPANTTLRRALTTRDAVAVGLAAMLGAGVFSVFAPAAGAAGNLLLVALGVAGVVAALNATATAQLAAASPVAGGAYVYGRERLGPWPGFLAGWGFVVGKTASCAAVAWTLGAYVAPGRERWVAVAAVLAITLLALGGVARTAAVSRVLATVVVAALIGVIAVGLVLDPSPATATAPLPPPSGPLGVLQAAGLLFFAFAGYARVATLGEEVRDPRRAIPRAVAVSLAIVLALYLALGAVLQLRLGADLATAAAPVADLVAGLGGPAVVGVRVVAAVACAASLLALVAGVGRTALAMARTGDLPRGLAVVDAGRGTPVRAELAVAVAVVALVLTVDLREMVGFSSFGVLLYYGVAQLAAWRQPRPERRMPRALNLLGALACLVLVATLPPASVVVGLVVLAVGVAVRSMTSRRVDG